MPIWEGIDIHGWIDRHEIALIAWKHIAKLTILSLVNSLWFALQDEVHTMGMALLGTCDVIQDGSHLGFH